VALSGGIDSLYSLLSLKESGAEVFALHAVFLPPSLRGPEHAESLERLRECVRSLGVRLHVAELWGEFEARVIRPFAEAYLAGKTPNPCARCNPAM
jgi:tRNA-specific 2-thiouridylase